MQAKPSDTKANKKEMNTAICGLTERIGRLTEGLNQFEGAIPGLHLNCFSKPTPPASYLNNASICLIA